MQFKILFFFMIIVFNSKVSAKLDFALNCVGNGETLVLIAEHESNTDRVFDDVENSTAATLTTTKPSFNRSELILAGQDEKQFFYTEFNDWLGSNYDKDIYFFLYRDTLKLTKYSSFPKKIGKPKVVANYSCNRVSNPEAAHSQVKEIFNKKILEKESDRQKQLMKNKI